MKNLQPLSIFISTTLREIPQHLCAMLLRLQFLSLVLIVKNWMTIVHVVQVAVNPKQVANVDIKIPLKRSCVTQGMSDIHVGF